MGGIPVAVVSSDDKFEFCMKLGAKGCINRKKFSHWGMLPHWKDTAAYGEWLKGARAFGAALWEVLGERRNPRLVFEHPGEDTVPTSIFVCDTGGMVVICAGTSGYNAVVDLRYLWMRQKRFQGSHFANDDQAKALNDLVSAGKVDPCLSETFTFEQIAHVHQLMYENLPLAPTWQGHSLTSQYRPNRAYFYGSADEYLLGVRDGDFKYILNLTRERDELYDLGSDPTEQKNIAHTQRDKTNELRGRTAAWLRSQIGRQ